MCVCKAILLPYDESGRPPLIYTSTNSFNLWSLVGKNRLSNLWTHQKRVKLTYNYGGMDNLESP
jgi:hypothetical protein